MKYIIEKSKIKSTNLPRKLTINNVDVYSKPEIADVINDFVTNIGQKLGNQIPKSSKTFETYINKANVIMDSKPLSISELREAFSLPRINKSPGVDDVSFNIMENCLGLLCETLIYELTRTRNNPKQLETSQNEPKRPETPPKKMRNNSKFQNSGNT